jgi:hypothetical protein
MGISFPSSKYSSLLPASFPGSAALHYQPVPGSAGHSASPYLGRFPLRCQPFSDQVLRDMGISFPSSKYSSFINLEHQANNNCQFLDGVPITTAITHILKHDFGMLLEVLHNYKDSDGFEPIRTTGKPRRANTHEMGPPITSDQKLEISDRW